jgi:alkylated DNA repair dioxygenase AlkB
MQLSLFGHDPPRVGATFGRVRRHDLEEGAWVDHGGEWLGGHQALFEQLRREASFERHRRVMYDRVVDIPRLLGRPPEHGSAARVLTSAAARLSERYGVTLESITLAYYRTGRDSVAMHGDKMGSLVDDTIVAIVSLGAPRRFLLKPVRGGRSLAFNLGWGDLLVMGGTCQRTYQHGVPKAVHAEERMSVMFRPRIPEEDAASEAAARKALVRAGGGSNRLHRVAS